MIVADVNLLIYYLVAGPFSDAAQRVFDRDSKWLAPAIWKSELLNVLATSVRENVLTLEKAQEAWIHAPAFVEDTDVQPLEVLDLSITSRFATFDCYYVALARKWGLRLVTADKKLLQKFSDVAVSIDDFADGK
jgi:predicted nucleic acid-binding protein